MRLPVLLVLLLTRTCLMAQVQGQVKEEDLLNSNVILVNPNGSVFLPGKYSTITTGSPYYTVDYYPATIFFSTNKGAHADKVRLDLLANNIHYLNGQSEEFVLNQHVEKIIFELPDKSMEIFVHGSSLPTDNTHYKKAWFQLIQQNELLIYKLYFKKIQENKPFNSGVIEKNIETYEKYFIIREGKLSPSKKSRPAN